MTTEAREWVELGGKKATIRQRWDIVRQWVVANGFLQTEPDTHAKTEAEKTSIREQVFQAMEKGISALREKKLAVYQSINTLIGYMEKKGCAPSTIDGHKRKLIKFYRFLELPEASNRDRMKDTVRKVDDYGVTEDRNFTREQIQEMLVKGTAKQKALVSFMTCTGARRGEAVEVKLSDIVFDKKVVDPQTNEEFIVPAIVYFPKRTTKTHRKRVSFLSSECVGFVKDHIADRDRFGKSAWLFDGWMLSRKDQTDRHMSAAKSYVQIRTILAKTGLVPPMAQHGKAREKKTGAHYAYHPHIFRSTSLEIMKSSGYPTDYAEYVVGHDIRTQESYLPSDDKLAVEWMRRCERRFCFLKEEGDVGAIKAKLQGEIEALSAKIDGRAEQAKSILARGNELVEQMQKKLGEAEATKRWSNHVWDFVKCRMESDDFDNALGEGYELMAQSGSTCVLRKPKQVVELE